MNTKSIISVALATALLGAASCNSEDDKELLGSVAESNTPHLITFNASAEAVGNSLQKASYSGDCVFTWTEGDEVNMFNSTDASLQQPFTVTKVMDGYDYCQIQGMGTGKGDYYSIYPYQADARFDFTGLMFQNVEMPAQQTVSAGQFDPKADLLVAKADKDLNLAYHRIGAKMGIKVPVSDIKEIRITAKTAIAGKFNVSADGQTVSNLTDASNTISLKCDGGFVSGNTYYACLLPVSGDPEISVTLYGADGKAISYASPVLSAVNRNDRIEAQPPTSALHKEVTVTLADLDWWNNVPKTATKVVFDSKSKVDVSSMKRKALVANGQIGIYANGSEYYVLSENDFEICMSGSLVNESFTGMFYGFKSLKNIGFNNFNTTAVTNMLYMFYNCSQLTELDLINFNTENVENMDCMFAYCSELTGLDLSNFNTAAVTDMYYMFYNCSQLTGLDLSKFNTGKVEDMTGMFHGCTALKTIEVSDKFTTNAVTQSSYMFDGCTALEGGMGTKVDDTGITYAKIDKPGQEGYFTDADNVYLTLEDIDWHVYDIFNTTGGLDLGYDLATKIVFDTKENQAAIVADLTKDNNKDDNMDNNQPIFFKNGEIGLYYKEVDGKYEYYYLSEKNKNIYMVDLTRSNGRVGMFEHSFLSTPHIKEIQFNNFNTEYVTNMKRMFLGCTTLKTLDLSGFNTSNVTSMEKMFQECSSLTTVYVSDKFTLNSIANINEQVFELCYRLVGGNGFSNPDYKKEYYPCTYARIDKAGQPGYFTEKQ